MNKVEKNQYEQLSLDAQEEYKNIHLSHPNWTHVQIMKKLAFSRTIDDMVESGGKDVDPNDPNILMEILLKTKEFLQNLGIHIEELCEKIDELLNGFAEAITRGVDKVKEILSNFWEWLKN